MLNIICSSVSTCLLNTCYVLGTITVIHSFRVYLFNTYVLDTVLANENTTMNNTHVPILVKPGVGEIDNGEKIKRSYGRSDVTKNVSINIQQERKGLCVCVNMSICEGKGEVRRSLTGKVTRER